MFFFTSSIAYVFELPGFSFTFKNYTYSLELADIDTVLILSKDLLVSLYSFIYAANR
nr:MAG TPA: hypothetical protein [Bacteriophage sp.]